MTEKRYSLGKIGCYRTKLIVDNETKHEMGNSVVVKRLNALHEENQRLKKQTYNLEHTRDFCAECCERLEKENEQLKYEIKEVRGEYEQLWMRL